MFSDNGSISTRQLKILLILDIFGKYITIFPRRVVQIGGQNGWVMVLIGAIFSIVSLLMINTIAREYPKDKFTDYVCKIVGKPIGILISIGFIINILVNISLELRIFSEILCEIMLFDTPFFVISFCMILVGSYMASKGYEARGRMGEILIFIIFIPFIFVFLIALFNIDVSNLSPFLREINIVEMVGGGLYSLFYFSGIQYIFLVYPYIKEKKKIKRVTIKSTLNIGLFLSILSIITIARFGKYDIEHQILPVLEMMNSVNIPGSFIERQDALIMTFWILSIFMIVNAGVFFASLIFKDLVKKGKHSRYVYLCAVIIFILSFLPKNIAIAYDFMEISYIIFGTIYLIIIPFFLLCIIKIKGVKNENK